MIAQQQHAGGTSRVGCRAEEKGQGLGHPDLQPAHSLQRQSASLTGAGSGVGSSNRHFPLIFITRDP